MDINTFLDHIWLNDGGLSCLTVLLTLLATFITLLYVKIYKETEKSSRNLIALTSILSTKASGDIKRSKPNPAKLKKRDKPEGRQDEKDYLREERLKKKVKRLTRELLSDKVAGVSALGLRYSELDRKTVTYETLFDEALENFDPNDEPSEWMKKCLLPDDRPDDSQRSLKKSIYDLVQDVPVVGPTTVVIKMNISEEGDVSLNNWEAVGSPSDHPDSGGTSSFHSEDLRLLGYDQPSSIDSGDFGATPSPSLNSKNEPKSSKAHRRSRLPVKNDRLATPTAQDIKY